MEIMNLANGAMLARHADKADTFFTRFKGLMFTKTLLPDHGLYLSPCQSIHTFFMNYSIDVLFVDEENKIISLQETMPPGKIGKVHRKACAAIELPAGTIKRTETKMGQSILIKN